MSPGTQQIPDRSHDSPTGALLPKPESVTPNHISHDSDVIEELHNRTRDLTEDIAMRTETRGPADGAREPSREFP